MPATRRPSAPPGEGRCCRAQMVESGVRARTGLKSINAAQRHPVLRLWPSISSTSTVSQPFSRSAAENSHFPLRPRPRALRVGRSTDRAAAWARTRCGATRRWEPAAAPAAAGSGTCLAGTARTQPQRVCEGASSSEAAYVQTPSHRRLALPHEARSVREHVVVHVLRLGSSCGRTLSWGGGRALRAREPAARRRRRRRRTVYLTGSRASCTRPPSKNTTRTRPAATSSGATRGCEARPICV